MGKWIGKLAMIAAFVGASSCSSSSSPAPAGCSASSCDGCCTAAGTCKTEQSASFCGLGGSSCQACSGSATCSAGSCQSGDSGPTCAQNGAASCDAFYSSWCTRMVQCCTAGGSCDTRCHNLVSGSSTDYNACNQDACKAWLTRIGYDCAAAKFTSKTVCADVTKKCTDDIPLMACTDLLSSTANLPASCKTWIAQF